MKYTVYCGRPRREGWEGGGSGNVGFANTSRNCIFLNFCLLCKIVLLNTQWYIAHRIFHAVHGTEYTLATSLHLLRKYDVLLLPPLLLLLLLSQGVGGAFPLFPPSYPPPPIFRSSLPTSILPQTSSPVFFFFFLPHTRGGVSLLLFAGKKGRSKAKQCCMQQTKYSAFCFSF